MQGIYVNLGHLSAVREQVGIIDAKLIGNLGDRFGLNLLCNLEVAGHGEFLLREELCRQVMPVA
jgi:hypothetical protein